jgi:hypothetical protein
MMHSIFRYLRYYMYEGIFRRPRLWSNTELKRFAHFFTGSVINVSAEQDLDKEAGFLKHFTPDFNAGRPYRSYFTSATEYYITNYAGGNPRGGTTTPASAPNCFDLDLEEPLPEYLRERFDVVFNHTTLEHILDVCRAFGNLCLMSRDIVILVVPAVQVVHGYDGRYRDYWRFTPFAVDELFQRNGFTVLYRSSTNLPSTSIYYFYIASKNPGRWQTKFQPLPDKLPAGLRRLNIGRLVFPLAYLHLYLEVLVRELVIKLSSGKSNRGGSKTDAG